MKKSKGSQLRVRITEDVRVRLDKLAKARGLGESLSDVVRGGVDKILEIPNGEPLTLDARTWKLLSELSNETDRPVSQIVDECVEGVFELLKNGKSPLIVEEIKLRRKYSGRSPVRTIANSK